MGKVLQAGINNKLSRTEKSGISSAEVENDLKTTETSGIEDIKKCVAFLILLEVSVALLLRK